MVSLRGPSACLVLGLALGLVGACGGGGNDPPGEAAVDTPPGPCGADAFFTGEVIDWDATNAKFCGVFNAKLTDRDDPAKSDATDPNGRFELCVGHAALTVADVAFSATPSECTDPKEIYPVPAVVVASKAVVDASVAFSARVMTATRQASMFTQVGQTQDPAKAQLVVHIVGQLVAASITSAHATTQQFNGAIWLAGDTGSDVFFPNVTPGSTMVSIGDGATAPVKVDLAAGKYTYVTMQTVLTATGW